MSWWLTNFRMLLLFASWMLRQSAIAGEPIIVLEDRTTSSGIQFLHSDGGGKYESLPRLMVAGMASLDVDNDGWMDLVCLNGKELEEDSPAPSSSAGKSNAKLRSQLYRNSQDGRFANISLPAQFDLEALSLGVAAADFDNDGFTDLVVSNFGGLAFFRNNGDGTFLKCTDVVGLGSASGFGAGVTWLDIDGDGLLDLYAARYVEFSWERFHQAVKRAFPYPPGPRDFPPASDLLFKNLGDGTFEDCSIRSGIAAHPGPSMGVVSADLDGDNDVDVFVCNDAAPNQLFLNDGKGHFTENALVAGVAFDIQGNANGSMGVDIGDVDGDGAMDLIVTNYNGQMPVLYKNLGGGLFEDATSQSGFGAELFAHANWGLGLIDFDNDGDRDLFVANGHFLKGIARIDDRTNYAVPNALLRNNGKGRFTDVTKIGGDGMALIGSSRGSVFEDWDHDGLVDVAVLNANGPAHVLANRTNDAGRALRIKLVGTRSSREAIGAMVEVQLPSKRLTNVKVSGRGYQSHYGSELHFGIGKSETPVAIRVRWPSGRDESFAPVASSSVTLVEGTGSRP